MFAELPVRLFVENRAEELVVAGLFRDFVLQKQVDVTMCWTASSAFSLAEVSLLRRPSQPVVLALNCDNDVDPDDFRAPFERMLAAASVHGSWNVALAVPDITKWARLEPNFAHHLAEDEKKMGPRNKYDVAVAFKDWACQTKNAIDLDQICRGDAEFSKMYNFIVHHLSPAAVEHR